MTRIFDASKAFDQDSHLNQRQLKSLEKNMEILTQGIPKSDEIINAKEDTKSICDQTSDSESCKFFFQISLEKM